MAMNVEKIDSYGKLGKALRLTEGKLEVIVPLDIGPRIIHVSLAG